MKSPESKFIRKGETHTRCKTSERFFANVEKYYLMPQRRSVADCVRLATVSTVASPNESFKIPSISTVHRHLKRLPDERLKERYGGLQPR